MLHCIQSINNNHVMAKALKIAETRLIAKARRIAELEEQLKNIDNEIVKTMRGIKKADARTQIILEKQLKNLDNKRLTLLALIMFYEYGDGFINPCEKPLAAMFKMALQQGIYEIHIATLLGTEKYVTISDDLKKKWNVLLSKYNIEPKSR